MNALEFELLLASARTVPDSSRIQRLVQQSIDWDAFWRLATHHNVRPLASRSLEMTCWTEVPEPSQRTWHEELQIIAGRNLFLLGELIGIVRALETVEIQVCILKGLLHGEILYGDVTLRETSDFDLLIRQEDFRKTVRVLQDLGYAPRSRANIEQMPELLKFVGECSLTGGGKLVDIDLHWNLSSAPLALAPDMGDFPLTPERLCLGGSMVQSIAIEELPLYLATQGGNDSWRDLRRVADLAEYLRRYPDTNWSPTVEAARRHCAERVVLAGLELAVRLLDATPPPGLARDLERFAVTEKLAASATNRMRQETPPGPLENHAFQIETKDGLAEKVRLLWSILTNRMTADTEWIRLPRSLWWLYRVLRPIRMVLKLGSR